MAKGKNLLSSNLPQYTSFQMIRSDGSIVPKALSDKLTSLAIRIIEENVNEKANYKGSLGNYFMEKWAFIMNSFITTTKNNSFRTFLRYREALAQPDYDDIDSELAAQFVEFWHKFENSFEASDTWYDTSCQSYPEYWICDGDHLLNWKDKGYRTVFELLQVTATHSTGIYRSNTQCWLNYFFLCRKKSQNRLNR